MAVEKSVTTAILYNAGQVGKLKSFQQKNIFPLALVNPIGKVSMQWHIEDKSNLKVKEKKGKVLTQKGFKKAGHLKICRLTLAPQSVIVLLLKVNVPA